MSDLLLPPDVSREAQQKELDNLLARQDLYQTYIQAGIHPTPIGFEIAVSRLNRIAEFQGVLGVTADDSTIV